ncbi:MAG: hypothetical protein QXR44_01340 [Thermoproteota archaeon]
MRGGYRKTHFQADTVTFYNVSNMGIRFEGVNEILYLQGTIFQPKITFRRERVNLETFYFHELILQSLVKNKIKNEKLNNILEYFDVNIPSDYFEVLGEKALPEGFVDIFIKMKHPAGSNLFFPVEVKTGKAKLSEAEQLEAYMKELGNECKGGVLIAKDFPKTLSQYCESENILPIKYYFENLDDQKEYTYEELLNLLKLEVVG